MHFAVHICHRRIPCVCPNLHLDPGGDVFLPGQPAAPQKIQAHTTPPGKPDPGLWRAYYPHPHPHVSLSTPLTSLQPNH